MVILAVDPGVEKTGYAVFNKNSSGFKYITSGLIKTQKNTKLEQRFKTINIELSKIITNFKPDTLIIEQLFFFKNQKTIVAVSQAQGALMLLAAQRNIKIEFLTPLQIKLTITGYGQADKKSVQKMLKIELKLDGELKQDDQADAIACGLAYCYLNKNLNPK
jgi:crossover junction endodeoxyribonuclease RuvC